MRRRIAVVVGGVRVSDVLLQDAASIGTLLVDAGFRVATGGRGGVMEAASRGARESASWREGDIIGILPSLGAEQANPYVDIVVPTGLNFARNVVLVAMADVVIAVGGGAGTLSEIALAWQHRKPVVCLDRGEGWSARLAGEALDDRYPHALRRARNPVEVMAAVEDCFPDLQ